MKNKLLALAAISEVVTGLTLLVVRVAELAGSCSARSYPEFPSPSSVAGSELLLHAVLTLLARGLGSPSGIARIATRNETRIELERLHVQIQQK